MAGEFFDDRETRAPEAREAARFDALPKQIAHAKETTRAFAKILGDADPEQVNSREALAELPVTRKSDLVDLQAENPPFGGLSSFDAGRVARIFASPGPIYEFQTERPDFWRLARALHAAGFRKGDVAHNSFAYHLTPGGWMMDSGARAIGIGVIPAGVGNSEQQVQAIQHLKPSGFIGTPDFLKVLLDKAEEIGADCSSIDKALVSGGALFPSLREEYTGRGVRTLQCYATADAGLIAYETADEDGNPNPGMIVDEELIVEIVRPGTGEPVPAGEVGEVVVTLFNPDYPLVRFATGDLSAVLEGESPCGRTNMRIKGWMGRADQTTKVKGMFVHPSQVASVVKRHDEVARARLVVEREAENDVMTLVCEVEGGAEGAGEALAEAVAESLQSACKMKGRVRFVTPGELPNDGKVIEDARSYE
ncbi:MAG: AMP-binding protein [Rhodovibrionaceae bacterium]|nr:AMP-binding protein [Rhodovibrionaceae bacterium]